MEPDEFSDPSPPESFPGGSGGLFDDVRAAPGDDALWDALEADEATEQRPEDVGGLYREVLRGALDSALAERIGRRAVAFHEEWFGEDSAALAEVLERVLAKAPGADWAFQRLTVAHTVAERWDELLGLYDRVVAATDDPVRRFALLDEAAQVARDFARDPGRAIGYHRQLLAARPDDEGLAGTLEQLIERQGHQDQLLAFWEERLPHTAPADVPERRAKIAEGYLDWLGRADLALDRARPLLADPTTVDVGVTIVERIAGEETTAPDVRRTALDLLRRQYEGDARADDAVAALERSLDIAQPDDRPRLLRDLADRLAAVGRRDEAVERYATLFQMAPGAHDVRARLRELAVEEGNPGRYVLALETAAASETDAELRFTLIRQATEARRNLLEDLDGAASGTLALLSDPALPPEQALPLTRRAVELLEATGRRGEHLEVLDRLSRMETDPGLRRDLLGRVARAAIEQERTDLALDAWGRRLELDPRDLIALDARVAILEEAGDERVADLVGALEARASGPVPPYLRRTDLARAAHLHDDALGDVETAVARWATVRDEFGSDRETVQVLGKLLARLERWQELADLLKETASTDAEHVADMLTALGDTYREHLGSPASSVAYYQGALRLDPTYEPALDGLHAVLDDPDGRSEAAEILADAYAVTERFPELVALLDVRLATHREAGDRLRLLREAAHIHEREGEDLEAALGAVRRALVLSPDDRGLERDLLRLGEAADAWDGVVAGLHDATEATADADRRAELRFLESQLREERLGERENALAGYLEVLGGAPHRVDLARAVIRTALATGALDQAAASFVHHVRARRELDPELVRVLEDAVAASGAVDGFPEVLEAAVLEDPSALPTQAASTVDRLILGWLEELDGGAGEAGALRALRRLHEREPADLAILDELVGAERRAPGPRLYAALRERADHLPDDLDPLMEAAELAASGALEEEPGDPELRAWAVVYPRALERWRSGDPATGARQPEECVRAAHAALLARDEAAADPVAVVERHLEASRWPVDASERSALVRRAAELSAEIPERAEEALRLYQRLLSEAEARGDDPAGLREMLRDAAALAERLGLVADLLELRRRELLVAGDQDRRRALRSEVARLAGELEARYDRRRLLEDNLTEQPGDPASLDELRELLRDRGLLADLADLLVSQADVLLVEQTREDEAVALLEEVVALAEGELSDPDRAFDVRRRLAGLRPSAEALDVLARLHRERGEAADAVAVYERRLADAEERGEDPAQRLEISVALVDALVEAGDQEAADTRLQGIVAAHPEVETIRNRLAERLRAQERFERLADLLTASLDHLDDGDEVLRVSEEAAALYEQVGRRDKAVPALERAALRKPSDRTLQTRYADALIAAERWEDAEAQLRRVVDAFGRRRSAERAAAHHKLADVLRGRGDLGGALEQLELSSSMDARNAEILAALSEVAVETGDDDRAERALRALLLVVRRQAPGEGEVGVGEVFLGLHGIAARRGQEREAADLREQAVQAAAQSAGDARRFKDVMLPRGEARAVEEVLVRRLEAIDAPGERAQALAELATVLHEGLGRTGDALGQALEALALVPDAWDIDDAARDYARGVAEVGRYADSLRERIDRARRPSDSALATELLLRLGPVLERDLGDHAGARAAYERVEAIGERSAEAWLGLARVYAAQGDTGEERRVLEHLVSASEAPGAPGDAVPRHAWLDAAYRLGESWLSGAGEERAEGLALVERAMAVEGDTGRGVTLLRAATHDAPNDDALLAAYGPLARAADDEAVLLDYLEKRSRRPDAGLEELQEGAELAGRLGELARADAFLERAIAVADEGPGRRAALWALVALAERREAAGDVDDAVAYLQAASEVAEDPAGATDYALAAGRMALDADRLPKAVEIFDGLRQVEPTDPRFFQPELVALRRAGDEEGLVAVVTSTLDALLDPQDRNLVRLEHARFLLGREGREPEAADVLRDILAEEPDDTTAAGLLADLFERIGFDEDLADLLERQLDGARANGNLEDARALSLRLGDLYAKVRRDDALDVYRRALEDHPEDRELAAALLALLGPDDDPRERIEVSERLLASEEGDRAARLALELADAWRSLEDPSGERRALERGYDRAPADEEVRARLVALFEEGSDHHALADHRRAEGSRLAAEDRVDEAVASYRDAARVEGEILGDPTGAAEALAAAVALVPTDGALLAELVAKRREAGETAAAVADVTGALEGLDEQSVGRVGLLRLRAALSGELGDEEARIGDLEAAYDLDPAKVAGDLVAAHETRRGAAAAVGDREEERDATYRLIALLDVHGDPQASRDVLAAWLDRDPRDGEGLRRLRTLDEARERWEDLGITLRRLLDLEEDEAQREVALALVDVWTRAGRPEEAREGLELAQRLHPDDPALRERLRQLYEEIGAHPELGRLLLDDAIRTDDLDARFILLRRSGELFLMREETVVDAVAPLEQAAEIRGDDHETKLLLVDALMSTDRFADAGRILEVAIAEHPRRRSPELAELQLRMARLAEIAGDRQLQMQWLNAALESDKNNGIVASELARLAMGIGDHEVALNALRVVTLAKTEGSMTRAEAFLAQAEIAQQRGEVRRALLWARKAKSEDPGLAAAEEFLRSLGEA